MSRSQPAAAFLPVIPAADPLAPAPDSLVLVLPGGFRLAVAAGFDPETLRRLLDALGDGT